MGYRQDFPACQVKLGQVSLAKVHEPYMHYTCKGRCDGGGVFFPFLLHFRNEGAHFMEKLTMSCLFISLVQSRCRFVLIFLRFRVIIFIPVETTTAKEKQCFFIFDKISHQHMSSEYRFLKLHRNRFGIHHFSLIESKAQKQDKTLCRRRKQGSSY